VSQVVAPFALTYTNRVPYLSVAEFKAEPTGLDLSNLVEARGQVDQDTALAALIATASAVADNYCFGAYGTLCATTETQSGQIRADRHGYFRVHPRFWPIIAINSFSVGSTPANLTPLTLSAENCWIEESSFVITQGTISSVTTQGPLEFGMRAMPGYRQFAQWTYVNGWPNLFLAADAAQGAQSIVSSVTPEGIFAGTQLNVWDPPNDEVVTVDASYVAGSATIPLTAPLAQAHVKGTNVSNLPKSIKRAVVLLTTGAIRLRGEVGFSIAQDGPPEVEKGSAREQDMGEAYELLSPFRCVVG
jgi:hypothetical protein